MKRLMQFTAAVAMAAAVSACAGDTVPDANNPATGTGTGAVGTTGNLDADREFLEEQMAIGTAEIELGRLAQQRGSHADVKEFGAMMVRDHQTAGEALRPIVAQVNTTGRTAARTDAHDDVRDKVEELSKLSGHDFDRKYIDEMIEDHEDLIGDLEGKAESASAHADVKAWAARTLPTVRQHLERAKAIKETLDRASNN